MFPSPLPLYISPRKLDAKLVRELKDAKYGTFTPLLPESVLISGEIIGKVLQLKFTDYDFNDRKKYPQFSPKKYLKHVHYHESGVTRLELQ